MLHCIVFLNFQSKIFHPGFDTAERKIQKIESIPDVTRLQFNDYEM